MESVCKTRHRGGGGGGSDGRAGGFGGIGEHSENNGGGEAGVENVGMVVDEDVDTEMELSKEEESGDEWKEDQEGNLSPWPRQNHNRHRSTLRATSRQSGPIGGEEDSGGVAAGGDHDLERETVPATDRKRRFAKGDEEDDIVRSSNKMGKAHKRLQRRNGGAGDGCSSGDNQEERDTDDVEFSKTAKSLEGIPLDNWSLCRAILYAEYHVCSGAGTSVEPFMVDVCTSTLYRNEWRRMGKW